KRSGLGGIWSGRGFARAFLEISKKIRYKIPPNHNLLRDNNKTLLKTSRGLWSRFYQERGSSRLPEKSYELSTRIG
ncbi:hypothetical protein, partial [Thermococcus sp.]|uniref:hypothetical protein n=1 Tax=Thermococcus sp. TaxID=35749 RepID=UPI0026389D9D